MQNNTIIYLSNDPVMGHKEQERDQAFVLLKSLQRNIPTRNKTAVGCLSI
jgi:hypothetical protein